MDVSPDEEDENDRSVGSIISLSDPFPSLTCA
jgi:hypothetical protein